MASLSNRLMVSREVTVSKPTASNRLTVNSPMANSKATAPPSTEAIPSRGMEEDMEDLLQAGMADISRLPPRNMGSALVEVQPWVWEEGCWVGCCLAKRWKAVMEAVMAAVIMVETTAVEVMAVEVTSKPAEPARHRARNARKESRKGRREPWKWQLQNVQQTVCGR